MYKLKINGYNAEFNGITKGTITIDGIVYEWDNSLPSGGLPDGVWGLLKYDFKNKEDVELVANSEASQTYTMGEVHKRSPQQLISPSTDGLYTVNPGLSNSAGRVGLYCAIEQVPVYRWRIKLKCDELEAGPYPSNARWSLFCNTVTESGQSGTESFRVEGMPDNTIRYWNSSLGETSGNAHVWDGIQSLNNWLDFDIIVNESLNTIKISINGNIVLEEAFGSEGKESLNAIQIGGTNKTDIAKNYPLTVQYILAEEYTV